MEKISWTSSVRNEEVLHRVNVKTHKLLIIISSNANWIGHVLGRNCL